MAGGLSYSGVSRVEERFFEKLKKDRRLSKDLKAVLGEMTNARFTGFSQIEQYVSRQISWLITLCVIACGIMIESFKCSETEKVFHRQFSKKLPDNNQKVAFRKLRMLNRSSTIQDLRTPPANNLEALSGNGKGQHSIRINEQWRICFKWRNGNAYDVELVDYH